MLDYFVYRILIFLIFYAHELLPWHEEATKGSSRLHNMSIAELEWAQAAKRLPQKSYPNNTAYASAILACLGWNFSNDAAACYNIVTCYAVRLALSDACTLVNRSHMPSDISDSLSGKNDISKGSGD
nr:hypothetical protein [Tanacetum cinerariifolium]